MKLAHAGWVGSQINLIVPDLVWDVSGFKSRHWQSAYQRNGQDHPLWTSTSLSTQTLRGTVLCLQPMAEPLPKCLPGPGSQGQRERHGTMVLLTLRLEMLPAIWAPAADLPIDGTVFSIRPEKGYISFRFLYPLSIRLWAISFWGQL